MLQNMIDTLFAAFGTDAVLITQRDPQIPVRVIPAADDPDKIKHGARRGDQFREWDIRVSQYRHPEVGDLLRIEDDFFTVAHFRSDDPERLLWTLECEKYHGQTAFPD